MDPKAAGASPPPLEHPIILNNSIKGLEGAKIPWDEEGVKWEQRNNSRGWIMDYESIIHNPKDPQTICALLHEGFLTKNGDLGSSRIWGQNLWNGLKVKNGGIGWD